MILFNSISTIMIIIIIIIYNARSVTQQWIGGAGTDTNKAVCPFVKLSCDLHDEEWSTSIAISGIVDVFKIERAAIEKLRNQQRHINAIFSQKSSWWCDFRS